MVHDTQNGFNANIGFEKHAPSPEILAKSIQIYIFNQNVKNVLPFANISDPNAYFTNMIFVLKPLVQASRFEFHEAYNRKNFLV